MIFGSCFDRNAKLMYGRYLAHRISRLKLNIVETGQAMRYGISFIIIVLNNGNLSMCQIPFLFAIFANGLKMRQLHIPNKSIES